MAEPAVTDNPARSRFEISVDGEPAGFADYERRTDKVLALVHTEIDERFGGRGLGGKLIEGALAQARAEGLSVVPYCPFARMHIERHPEHLELVPADRRAELFPDGGGKSI